MINQPKGFLMPPHILLLILKYKDIINVKLSLMVLIKQMTHLG